MHERGVDERGADNNEATIEGEALAMEQTRGKIGQTSFPQVNFSLWLTTAMIEFAQPRITAYNIIKEIFSWYVKL